MAVDKYKIYHKIHTIYGIKCHATSHAVISHRMTAYDVIKHHMMPCNGSLRTKCALECSSYGPLPLRTAVNYGIINFTQLKTITPEGVEYK